MTRLRPAALMLMSPSAPAPPFATAWPLMMMVSGWPFDWVKPPVMAPFTVRSVPVPSATVRVLLGLMLSVPPESIVNWSTVAATLRVTVWGLRIVTVSALVVGTSVAADQVEQAGEGALSQVLVEFQFPDAAAPEAVGRARPKR